MGSQGKETIDLEWDFNSLFVQLDCPILACHHNSIHILRDDDL
jgi:hypothetical protein